MLWDGTTIKYGICLNWLLRAAVVAATILAGVAVAQPFMALFSVFTDDQGTLQTQSSSPMTLNPANSFFDPSIGTNGQACVTCHSHLLA
jgi:ABC-type transport system substrate-binding protein